MKRIIPCLIALCMSGHATAGVVDEAKGAVEKIIEPSWMERAALKWGMVGSFCAYQALNGALDITLD